MSYTFSLPKSTTTLKLILATAAASLLTTLLPSTTSLRLEQPTQLSDTSFITPQETEPNRILVLGTAAVGGVAIAMTANAISNTHNSHKSNLPLSSPASTNVSFNQASHKLQKRLMTLLHNDRQAANRLLNQAQWRYPNRSTDWYVDKVIYDLERDRL